MHQDRQLKEVADLLDRSAPRALTENEIAAELRFDRIEVRAALRKLWRLRHLHCTAPDAWSWAAGKTHPG